METACPNPSCGTVYTITPQHVGRQFPCRGCGAMLTARADGLHLAGPVAMPTAPQPTASFPNGGAGGAPAGMSASPSSARPGFFGRESLIDRLPVDLFTLLFALGSILAVYFLFMPLLDKASVARASAKVQAGELQLRRAETELRLKSNAQSSEQEALRKRREQWEKDKVPLQMEVDEAQTEVGLSGYWYTWGMLFAFLMLSVSSVGYLSPSQSKVRRVVGSIVICAMLLLIFIVFVAGSASVRF